MMRESFALLFRCSRFWWGIVELGRMERERERKSRRGGLWRRVLVKEIRALPCVEG